MNIKKTLLSTAITTSLCTPSLVTADIIDIDFTGVFTFVSSTAGITTNADAVGDTDGQGNSYQFGSRTPFSGSAIGDTTTGLINANIDAFSFLGNGLASATAVTFQAIGDGLGNPTAGTLLAMTMNFSWNGSFGFPVTAILDAAGFFNSIGAIGSSWTVQTGCTSCATSATPDTFFSSAVGAVPIAMTTYNTAGTTLGSLFPLSTDGIAGSPLTTTPFIGQNFAFDFTTINATNVPQVPVPASAWLLGSGLLGLFGVARRRG